MLPALTASVRLRDMVKSPTKQLRYEIKVVDETEDEVEDGTKDKVEDEGCEGPC